METTPLNIQVYTARITQSGTNAPVAQILHNTLGEDIVWSYESTGNYLATIAGGIPFVATFVTQVTDNKQNGFSKNDNTTIRLTNRVAGAFANDFALPVIVEIRRYNINSYL